MKNVLFAVSLFGILLGIFDKIKAQKGKQPNIILIMSDQHHADVMSSVGHPDVETPNIDRLAQSGVSFKYTYVSFPLCSPARASIFTGLYPHSLGIYSNRTNNLSPENQRMVIANILSENGYDCVYAGKWHVPAKNIETNDGNGFMQIHPFGDDGLAEACIEYLKKVKDDDKPFFLVASFDNPHNICEYARNQPLPYGNIETQGLDMRTFPDLPRNFAHSPYEPEALRMEQAAVPRHYPTTNYTPDDWRRYKYVYNRLVEKVDIEIGKILNAVEQLQLDDNSVIIYTSDHGDGYAHHMWNQKTSLYEESIRVPFIISYKDKLKLKGGFVEKEHIINNGLDIVPTILDYAGVDKPFYLVGKSLKPILEGRKVDWRSETYVQTMFDGDAGSQTALRTRGRAVVSKKYKYIVYDLGKDKEQLFDLENDPDEMINLAVSSKYDDVLNKYRRLLKHKVYLFEDKTFMKRMIEPE